MKRTTIIEIIIFLYSVLFIYTGISKLIEYSTFNQQLSESPIFAPIAPLISATLPWAEFIIVLLLILPRWRLKGFYLAFAMMTAFTVYIIGLLAFTDNLPCSCGGIIAELSWPQHIALNGCFILLAVIGIVLHKRERQLNQKTWTELLPFKDKSPVVKGL
jgi:hypothetical protein